MSIENEQEKKYGILYKELNGPTKVKEVAEYELEDTINAIKGLHGEVIEVYFSPEDDDDLDEDISDDDDEEEEEEETYKCIVCDEEVPEADFCSDACKHFYHLGFEERPDEDDDHLEEDDNEEE